MRYRISLLLLILLSVLHSNAADYFGRFSLGSYTAIERFSDQNLASDSNDFQTTSGRMYFRAYDLGSGKWDFVADLRDKYDQFSELNQSQFQLDPKNYFQVRQLYTGNFVSKSNFNLQMGRFSVLEVGGQYVDGLVLQGHLGSRLRMGAVGGNYPLNDQSQELVSDSKSTLAGVYAYYEPTDLRLVENLIIKYAWVSRRYSGEEDRRYVYQNIYYQWNRWSRVYSQAFFDSLPSSYVQTWNFNWDQGLSDSQLAHLHFMGVDAVQYRRINGVREQLEASPYQQTLFQWDWKISGKSKISPSVLHGERKIDGLSKDESKLKFLYADFASPNWELNGFGGTRKNFKSKDQFAGLGLGYYAANWEFSLDFESGQEAFEAETLHPVQAGVTTSYIMDRQMFMSLAMEYSRDEHVTITSVLAKLTYRFGSKEIPPLRDGAPARGSL